MRMKRWADTPLGPPETWPQSLKTIVRVLLTSRYQMWMGWGDDLTFFYNDAYRPTLGIKHDWALGAPAREVWKEIWDDIGPRIEHVLNNGEATWDEGLLLFLERSGFPEETYHTFSYSPLADDLGVVVGMLCVVTEETERIIGARRLSSLRELASAIAGKNTRTEIFPAVAETLSANVKDLPFTLTYVFDADGTARLACTSGLAPGDPIAPTTIDPAGTDNLWPVRDVLSRRTAFVVKDLEQRLPHAPRGAWDSCPREAVISPIARRGQDTPAGFLIAAANPYRTLDDAYRGFINLIAGQIGSGLAHADAYEEARRRVDALAEIDRAKTAFFSNVSHEFRTPLTLMLGPLEDILVKTADEPFGEYRSMVQVAHRNGMRLLKLVNTLLDFSRLEAGRMQAHFEPVDLAAYTADLASSFQSAVDMAGLRLNIDRGKLDRPVYVDRDMWEKIVLNLLSNAFKFTFEGAINIEVSLSPDSRAAQVTIRDTGTGIPQHELPTLFERFRRVEGARGRSIEGSGIGLALVQELVKLHGGSIQVVSELGKGSAFTVSIPFGNAHLPSDCLGQNQSNAGTSVRARAYVDEALGWLSVPFNDSDERSTASSLDEIGQIGAVAGKTGQLVLLADDNADMRDYLQGILRAAGLRVEAVTNGEEALAAAQRNRPDLVLSDVMMPKLDGFGLLATLREDRELRDTPFLLLSARAGEEAKIEGLSAGADDYLTKPFSAKELLARVRVNLEMAALRREALKLENELRQEAQMAQERAENILASINDGFFALGPDWRFTYVNAAAERMLACTASELVGKNYWETYPDTVGTIVETNYRQAMAERQSVAFENFYEPWQRWFDIRAYPARDGGLSVYFQDVSERKQAEDTLRHLNESLEAQVVARTQEVQAKEARLRAIFETSFTYQGLMELDGTLRDANSTSLAGVDSKLENVFGKPFWETPWFTGTPGMPELVRTAIPAVAAGEVVRREINVNLPVGGWRWFDFQMRPVRAANGAVIAIVPEAVDVTERRLAENALRQAQKMEGIGQLTGGVAHDFNNLLTIIMGNLETLQRQLKSPAVNIENLARPVDSAMRGAQRAVTLTQRLLAFSRQQPLDPKPVDVSRLVVGMSDLLRRTLGEQIAVETVLAGGLWRVHIDSNQLEMAILNLAVNARDAMPDGGKLTIETSNAALDEGYATEQAEVVPGQYVMLAVSDNGIGMSRDTLTKAFEPFFTTKDVGHGTGLGLSQVYGFVKQSGGHVKIYSELGEGTTVKIYLPRFHSYDGVAVEEPAVKVTRAQVDETILIVEDDEDVRAYTSGNLRELGYIVLEAHNGPAALDILEKRPEIKLLFTDVGLPGGMNGRQLADSARKLRRDLRVLFTTGYARNAIVHDGRLDPGVQLITKPFTYVELADKLRDVFDAKPPSMRILVVEDEPLIQMLAQENLEELGFRVEVASTAADARNKLLLLHGEVCAAIIDVGLPDGKGDALVRELRAIYPSLPFVIASGHDERTVRNEFSQQEHIAFLRKPYSLEGLRAVLQSVGAAR